MGIVREPCSRVTAAHVAATVNICVAYGSRTCQTSSFAVTIHIEERMIRQTHGDSSPSLADSLPIYQAAKQ